MSRDGGEEPVAVREAVAPVAAEGVVDEQVIAAGNDMVDNISEEEPTMAVREDQMVLEEAAGKSTDEGSGDEGGRRLRGGGRGLQLDGSPVN